MSLEVTRLSAHSLPIYALGKRSWCTYTQGLQQVKAIRSLWANEAKALYTTSQEGLSLEALEIASLWATCAVFPYAKNSAVGFSASAEYLNSHVRTAFTSFSAGDVAYSILQGSDPTKPRGSGVSYLHDALHSWAGSDYLTFKGCVLAWCSDIHGYDQPKLVARHLRDTMRGRYNFFRTDEGVALWEHGAAFNIADYIREYS